VKNRKQNAAQLLTEETLNQRQSFIHLYEILRCVNHVALTAQDCRNTCLVTSCALRDVLAALQIPAKLLCVSPTVHAPNPDNGKYLRIQLRDDVSPVSSETCEYWPGHLVVVAFGKYLMDPTLDALNEIHPYVGARPFLGQVSTAFLAGDEPYIALIGEWGSTVTYTALPDCQGYESLHTYDLDSRRKIGDLALRMIFGDSDPIKALIHPVPWKR
jgi:hypothetical protein